MHATQPQQFAYVQQPWAYGMPAQAPAPQPQPPPAPAPTLDDVIHTLDVHTKQMNAMVETIVSNLNDLSERLAVVEQRVGIQPAAPQTPPALPPKQESPVIAKVDRVIDRLDGLVGRLEQTAHERARLNDQLHDVIVQLKSALQNARRRRLDKRRSLQRLQPRPRILIPGAALVGVAVQWVS